MAPIPRATICVLRARVACIVESPSIYAFISCRQSLRAFATSQHRASTSIPPASPLLVKLRSDLKAALQSKDTNRLNVLRALLADITNASKTTSPITTNPQFLSLIRKRLAAAEGAVGEFKAGGRQDLVDKEENQMGVLKDYMKDVGGDAMSAEELKDTIAEVLEESKAQGRVVMGDVLKKLLGPGGKLEGKGADGKEVAKLVRSMGL